MALAVGIGNPGLSMTSASSKPDATITITHVRDQMMCQQHLTSLVLPPAVARSESCRGQRAHRMPVQTFEARSFQEGKT
jgi:hypothetical protein